MIMYHKKLFDATCRTASYEIFKVSEHTCFEND
jgi:hypothetical protein